MLNYTAYCIISFCEDYCNEGVLELRDNSFGRSRAHFSMAMLKNEEKFSFNNLSIYDTLYFFLCCTKCYYWERYTINMYIERLDQGRLPSSTPDRD